MTLELFLDLISPPCRAIYIFAKMNNIHFNYFPVDLLKGQQHSREFEKLNILKTVPVLREETFILTESVAILLYLTRKYSTSLCWYPPDIHLQASIDEYMAWEYEGLHMPMKKVLWVKLLIPKITGQEVPKEKVDALENQIQTNIQLFSNHFLKDQLFVTGESICLADLMAAVEMMQSVGAKYNVFENNPKINEWHKRVEESVGSTLFQEAHERLLTISNWDPSILEPSVKEKILIMIQSITK